MTRNDVCFAENLCFPRKAWFCSPTRTLLDKVGADKFWSHLHSKSQGVGEVQEGGVIPCRCFGFWRRCAEARKPLSRRFFAIGAKTPAGTRAASSAEKRLATAFDGLPVSENWWRRRDSNPRPKQIWPDVYARVPRFDLARRHVRGRARRRACSRFVRCPAARLSGFRQSPAKFAYPPSRNQRLSVGA